MGPKEIVKEIYGDRRRIKKLTKCLTVTSFVPVAFWKGGEEAFRHFVFSGRR